MIFKFRTRKCFFQMWTESECAKPVHMRRNMYMGTYWYVQIIKSGDSCNCKNSTPCTKCGLQCSMALNWNVTKNLNTSLPIQTKTNWYMPECVSGILGKHVLEIKICQYLQNKYQYRPKYIAILVLEVKPQATQN